MATGKWANQTGEFVRKPSAFRNWVTQDGEFQPESGRYHLYVSYACPFAHRTLIVRKLKGLEDVITVDVVDHFKDENAYGWRFNPEVEGCTPDTVNGFSYLRELYFMAEPEYSGRFGVPVLFDKKKRTIVSNESSEIIRMLNSEFNALCKNPQLDLYPEHLRAEIDSLNEWIYRYSVLPATFRKPTVLHSTETSIMACTGLALPPNKSPMTKQSENCLLLLIVLRRFCLVSATSLALS